MELVDREQNRNSLDYGEIDEAEGNEQLYSEMGTSNKKEVKQRSTNIGNNPEQSK